MKKWIILWGWAAVRAAEWSVGVEVAEPTLIEVRPGVEQWEAAEGEVARMRIRDGEGRGVETAREALRESSTRIEWIARKASVAKLRPLDGNRLELEIEVSEEAGPVRGMEFRIPMTDFERTARVWGVDATGGETVLVEDGLLVDYSRYADVRRTRVTWEEAGFRRFRVEIDGAMVEALASARRRMVREEGGAEVARETWTRGLLRPLRIDGVSALERREVLRRGRGVSTPLEGLEWREMEETDGERVLELTTRFRPVNRVELDARDPVFSRRVRVRRPLPGGTGERWRDVADATVSKLVYRDTREEDTAIELSPISADRLRVRIAREGRRPLEVTEIRAFGPRWRLVFLAEPGRTYRLGVDDEPSPASAPAVQRLLDEGHTPEPAPLHSGDATDREPEWRLMDLLYSRGFFVFALVVAGTVVGVALYKAAKEVSGADEGSSG